MVSPRPVVSHTPDVNFWNCIACGAQNSREDGTCQFCECGGVDCKRDSCDGPCCQPTLVILDRFSVRAFDTAREAGEYARRCQERHSEVDVRVISVALALLAPGLRDALRSSLPMMRWALSDIEVNADEEGFNSERTNYLDWKARLERARALLEKIEKGDQS